MRMVRPALALFALVCAAWVAPAWADKRVALVVGNSAYRHTSTLPNPRNDAQAIGAALKRLGFDVDVQIDLDTGLFSSNKQLIMQ
jgi:hypothetical protein